MKDLNEIYQSFELGIRSPKATEVKEYLNNIGLDYTELRIGFNSGQFHHNEPQELKDHYQSLGLLTKSKAGANKKDLIAYTVFGREGVVFPLLNSQNKVVNLFAIRFKMQSPQEDYLNREGLYPRYPNPNTKKLFIVPTVLESASLLQSKALENKEAVLALHNGELLPQHREAIKSLLELEEIIIIKN